MARAQQVTSSTPVFGAATTFGYDARGSRTTATTAGATTQYAYAASGALASVTSPSGTVSYTSDARRLRQSRTVGAVTKQFTWSSVGGLPVLLDDGGHSYLYGPSSTPVAQVDDVTGKVEYLHADLLGTPRLVTGESGAVAGTVSFDAFGNRTTHSGTQSAFGFTGNWTDPDTGLLYLRARDYDPKTGQFLTVDPAVDRTRQPYAYAYNSPVSVTDPTGLDAASDAQAKADAELYGRPYILMGILQNVMTLGTYGVEQSLCAGNDLWTSLNMAYNPVYAIVEGGTNAVRDIQNGESGFRVFMDVLQFAGGVAGVAGIGFGVGLAGSIGRAGVAGRVGAAGPSTLAGEAAESGGNFVYRALNASDRASVDAGLGIGAKNPGGSWSVGEHVERGSGPASWANDPWIATSRNPGVAAAFDSGYGVVRINLDLVKSPTAEAWKTHPWSLGREGLVSRTSFWQQEVSIFGSIPAEAIG